MIIRISDYRLSEVFELFADAVCAHGGDGIGIFMCEDPEGMAHDFEEWCLSQGGTRVRWIAGLDQDTRPGYVNFHDDNENFIFTNDEDAVAEPFLDCLIRLEGDPKPE